MSKNDAADGEYYGARPIQAAARSAKPTRPAGKTFPASYSPEDFPWDKLDVLPAKQSTVRKTAYFSNVKLRGAPSNYRLRMHLLGIKSNFGFSPPMEEKKDEKQKWSYSCELEDKTLASFQTGDSIIQPLIYKATSGVKNLKLNADAYQRMAKEPKPADEGGVEYPPVLKVKVEMNEQGEPTRVVFLEDNKVVKNSDFWKQFKKKPHTADALIELSRVYFAANKCGMIWNLIRLRPFADPNQDAIFPYEAADEDEDDEGSEKNGTNDKEKTKETENNDDEEDADSAIKNRKRKRINNARGSGDENENTEEEEDKNDGGQKRPKILSD